MKIYELPSGRWIILNPICAHSNWRQIDPDPTIAHTIELESCNAVITADSCYFRDAPAPVLTLEEMQRVTKSMEMLREAQPQALRKTGVSGALPLPDTLIRVEVIDAAGRSYVNWNNKNRISADLQDEGRTLKVFVKRQ